MGSNWKVARLMMADEEEGVVDNWEDADTEVSPVVEVCTHRQLEEWF